MRACGDEDEDGGPKVRFRFNVFKAFVATCALAAGVLGCGDSAEVAPQLSNQAPLQEARAAIRSEADLRTLLVLGMTTNEVTARLGRPDWEETTGSGAFWHYQLAPFPADEDMQGARVIGVILDLTNGHLARWDCAYAGGAGVAPVTSRQVLPDTASGDHPAALKFFVVSSHPVEQGRYVDTKRLPELGYISSKPEFALDRLKQVTVEEREVSETDTQSRKAWLLRCSLQEQDVARFRAITTANVLRRVLIMVGDEPIVAPIVRAPVEDGRFEIECQDRALMESVTRQLTEMERKR